MINIEKLFDNIGNILKEGFNEVSCTFNKELYHNEKDYIDYIHGLAAKRRGYEVKKEKLEIDDEEVYYKLTFTKNK